MNSSDMSKILMDLGRIADALDRMVEMDKSILRKYKDDM